MFRFEDVFGSSRCFQVHCKRVISLLRVSSVLAKSPGEVDFKKGLAEALC